MGDPVVRARGLVKSYGAGRSATRVLDGIDLDVAPGELVAVLGRSGSGKSTLLHLLGGLDRADAGTLEVAGIRLDRGAEARLTELRRRHVGFVFQSFQLLPELSGLENVLLPARLAGDLDGSRERVDGLLERLGLTDVATRLPGSLSGGEQQRLAVVRSIVNEPTLVLADEPTGNLDAESGAGVLGLLRELGSGERAVVLVTHDAESAAAADRVLRLEAGRLTG